MKLCKDCRWQASALCRSPKRISKYVSVVTGNAEYLHYKCCTVRQGGPITKYVFMSIGAYECGVEARWFEAKL